MDWLSWKPSNANGQQGLINTTVKNSQQQTSYQTSNTSVYSPTTTDSRQLNLVLNSSDTSISKKDSVEPSFSLPTSQSSDQGQSQASGINPLILLAGAGVGAYLLLSGGKKK